MGPLCLGESGRYADIVVFVAVLSELIVLPRHPACGSAALVLNIGVLPSTA
jgi:hypothetical protein